MAWGLFVRPYIYDYDLAMLTMVVALLPDTPVRRLGDHACLHLLACLCIVQFVGMAW